MVHDDENDELDPVKGQLTSVPVVILLMITVFPSRCSQPRCRPRPCSRLFGRIGDRGAVNTRERRELVRPVITQREDFNDRNAAYAERIRYE